MIDIKNIGGSILFSVLPDESAVFHEELMTSDYVQLSWDSDVYKVIPAGTYIEYDGEKYKLLDNYTPSQQDECTYQYTPQFQSRIMNWGKQITPIYTYAEDGTTVKGREMDWEFTGSPADAMYIVKQAIKNETGEDWTIQLADALPATITISSQSSSIFAMLNTISGECGTEWWADKKTNTLYLSKCISGDAVTLEVGDNVQVPTVTNDSEGYFTRFYSFGSTRNITQDYEGGGATNYIVNKRLTLNPTKYPNGYKDIKEGLKREEVFVKVLFFDDIYPSSKLTISDVRARLKYRLDNNGNKIKIGGTDEEPIYEQYAIWYFQIEGFDFNPSTDVIEGLNLSVSFQSGQLAQREFELTYHEKATTVNDAADVTAFNIKQGDYEINIDESTGVIIPGTSYIIPQEGDSIILFNIVMPEEYVASAQDELEKELDKAMLSYIEDNNTYQMSSDPTRFYENETDIQMGQAVTFVNGSKSLSTRVQMVEKRLDLNCYQTIKVGNKIIKGNTQQLKDEVASVNQNLDVIKAFNELSSSLSQAYANAQREMIEGFAAIKELWKLETDEHGNKYAYTKYDIFGKGGITAFTAGKAQVPSIYEGIPFDNKTIWLNPETRLVEVIGGIGEEFDSSKMWSLLGASTNEQINKSHLTTALSGYATTTQLSTKWTQDNTKIAHWDEAYNLRHSHSNKSVLDGITNDKVSKWDTAYSWGNHAKAGYAKQTSLDAVSGKLNDFLEGSDTDTIINKWKELESFLSGMTESDNLADILSTKADKSFVTSELKKYVTLTTSQTISGAKTFTSLLTTAAIKAKGDINTPNVRTSDSVYINGIRLYKSPEGNLILDGNLLVTGGVTAYSDGSSSGGSSGGLDVDLLWEILTGTGTQQINKTHLTDALNGYATQSWVTSQKYLKSVSIATISDLNSSWDALLKAAPSVYVTRHPTISEVTNKQSLVIKLNSGTTEGNNQFTYNATAAKTINITPSGIGAALSSHNHSWENITSGKPTTLSGYGITDAYTKTESDSRFVNVSGDTMNGHLTFNDGYGIACAGSSLSIGRYLSTSIYLQATGEVYFTNKAGKDYKIWHAGNDGSGSGLDADTLDGYHYNFFPLRITGRIYINSSNEYAKLLTFTRSSEKGWMHISIGDTNNSNSGVFGEYMIYWHYDNFSSQKAIYLSCIYCRGIDISTKLYAVRTSGSTFDLYFRPTNIASSVGYVVNNYSNSCTVNKYTTGTVAAITPTYTSSANTIYTNASSATKLQTPRTIWGQSFDGTSNVNGTIRIQANEGSYSEGIRIKPHSNGWSALLLGGMDLSSDTGTSANSWGIHNNNGNFFINRGSSNSHTGYELCNVAGRWGIGTLSPSEKLHVAGNIYTSGFLRTYHNSEGWIVNVSREDDTQQAGIWYSGYTPYLRKSNINVLSWDGSYVTSYVDLNVDKNLNVAGLISSTFSSGTWINSLKTAVINCDISDFGGWINGKTKDGRIVIASYPDTDNNLYFGYASQSKINAGTDNSFTHYMYWTGDSGQLTVEGNILATGGITCYSSDARAKTIIEEVSLSLKQISESPTIRFKWNGWNIPDDGKTHIGGIAQYVQKLLPECILDADGVLNMDYATTAYIYSVQTARHLQTYETRTDRKIKKLEKRVRFLEKQLKKLGYEEVNTLVN